MQNLPAEEKVVWDHLYSTVRRDEDPIATTVVVIVVVVLTKEYVPL